MYLRYSAQSMTPFLSSSISTQICWIYEWARGRPADIIRLERPRRLICPPSASHCNWQSLRSQSCQSLERWTDQFMVKMMLQPNGTPNLPCPNPTPVPEDQPHPPGIPTPLCHHSDVQFINLQIVSGQIHLQQDMAEPDTLSKSPNPRNKSPETIPPVIKQQLTSWSTLAIGVILIFLFVRFIIPSKQVTRFDIEGGNLVLHINETQTYQEAEGYVTQFHRAIDENLINSVDVSLAASEFGDEDIHAVFSKRFPVIRAMKLNLGSTKLTDTGIEFALSRIPITVESLDLSLDAISTATKVGQITGKALTNMRELKDVRLSFILSDLKDQGAKAVLYGLQTLEKLENLTLVLMGDQLTGVFGNDLKEFLTTSKATFKRVNLNLFSNKLGAEGVKPVAEGIEQLSSVEALDLDFYFNNLTETGAKAVSESVSKLTQLKELRLNLDFNGINNEGGEHVGKALSKLVNLEALDIGVATKNFGYLGYKAVIDGVQTLGSLRKLVLRCGVNKVGANGAAVTADAFARLPNLQELHINFLENYVGDEGAIILAQGIVKHLHALKVLTFDVAFNGLRGYGFKKALEVLSERRFDELTVSGSSNELRNTEAKELVPVLQKLLRRNKVFRFEFLNTAITPKASQLLTKVFRNYPNSLVVNTIELTEQEKAKNTDEAIDYSDPENVGTYEEHRDSEEAAKLMRKNIEEARTKAQELRRKDQQRREDEDKNLKNKEAAQEKKKQEQEEKKQEEKKQEEKKQEEKKQEEKKQEQQEKVKKQEEQEQEKKKKLEEEEENKKKEEQAKRQEEENKRYEEEKKRQEVESKRIQEQDNKRQEEERKRQEVESKRQEEERKRQEEESRRQYQETQKQEEQKMKQIEEKKKQEAQAASQAKAEEAKRQNLQKERQQKEKELLRIQEEAKKQKQQTEKTEL